MALIELRPPTRRDLFVFGILLPLFTTMVGLWAMWILENPQMGTWILGCGLGLSVAFAVIPPLRMPIYKTWTTVTYPIGWVVSHVILALVYFGLFTPIGLMLRLFGRDPLDRRFDPKAHSYWIARKPPVTIDRYFRQF